MSTEDEMKTVQATTASSQARPRVLMSHPTGNQYVRNALQSLVEHKMLAEFWTTIAWNTESRWNKVLPQGLRRQLARRSYVDVPREQLKTVPWREIVRLGMRSSALERLLSSGERPFSTIGMFRNFDGRVAQRLREVQVDAIYAHEGGALLTFREAKKRSVPALYELPSGHWYWERDLMRDEAVRQPDYASVLPKLSDSEGHMQWKDEELALADCVVVPSQHIRRTLSGVVPDERIRVVAYGAPPVRKRQEAERQQGRPLQVLFAGGIHQRKGIG